MLNLDTNDILLQTEHIDKILCQLSNAFLQFVRIFLLIQIFIRRDIYHIVYD